METVELRNEIFDLDNSHWDGHERQWGEFWSHVREINKYFKESRLSQQDRAELWNQFSLVCSQAKAVQSDDHNEFISRSTWLFDDIRSDIESAKVNTLFGFDPPNIAEMKRLGQVLRKAGHKMSEHKQEMSGAHKTECFNRIQEIRQEHDYWWESLKAHKAEKRAIYFKHIRNNLASNYEKLAKAENARDRTQTTIDNLRDRITDSSSDNWIAKAENWLSEHEERLKSINETIERIQKWIDDDEEKLREENS